jgi:hypothetical protein
MITTWSDDRIESTAERYAGHLDGEFRVLESQRVTPVQLQNLHLCDIGRSADLRHLRRLHQALAEDVTRDLPSLNADIVDHLAFAQSLATAKRLAGPNPIHRADTEESAQQALDLTIQRIDAFRRLGSLLIEEWAQSEGEHYLVRYDDKVLDTDATWGSCAIGNIQSQYQPLFKLRYTKDQPTKPDAYEDWLAGVGGHYASMDITLALYPARIALIKFLSPRSGQPVQIHLSKLAKDRLGLAEAKDHLRNPLYDFMVGDASVEDYIDRMQGNPSSIIGQFIRKSNPSVAMPFLEEVVRRMDYTDRGNLYDIITRNFNMSPDRHISFAPEGRMWLQQLGLVGS